MPKELLPIIGKPIIQYAVEEAIAAGMIELDFLTGRPARASFPTCIHDAPDNTSVRAAINSDAQR